MYKKNHRKIAYRAMLFSLVAFVLGACKSAPPVQEGHISFHKDNFKNIKEIALVSVQMPKLMSKVRSDILIDFEQAEKSREIMSQLHQQEVEFFVKNLKLPFKISLLPQTYQSSALESFVQKISSMPAYQILMQAQEDNINDLLIPARLLPVELFLYQQDPELLEACAQLAKDLQVQGVMFVYANTPIQQSAAHKDKANVHVYAQVFAHSAENKPLISWQGVLKKADELTLAPDNVILFDETLHNIYKTSLAELLQKFENEFNAIEDQPKK